MNTALILARDSSAPHAMARYEAAKAALAECARVDECQDLADKTAALAHYARQRDDKELLDLARSIQARAVRRCGELLKEIAPKDTPPGGSKSQRIASNPLTRTQAARDAGMTKSQKQTALRVASVPKQDFETAVDIEKLTVGQIAIRGMHPRKTSKKQPRARPAKNNCIRCLALIELNAELDRRRKEQECSRSARRWQTDHILKVELLRLLDYVQAELDKLGAPGR